jgi:DNA replication protein DnaC
MDPKNKKPRRQNMLPIPAQDKLRTLKLRGMLKGLEEQLASSSYETLSFEERLGLLIDRELTEQENRRLETRLRQARLRQTACVENIDFTQARGLDKGLVRKLSGGKWIEEHLNALITGPCGVGKSFIACALAHKACLLGHSVLYTRAPRMLQDLALARGDGRYLKLMRALTRTHVLVIDDWGLAALNDSERGDILEILEDRHQRTSTIVTSQLPVKHWHEIIGNPTLADAILDRLVHNAYSIELKGESMRKTSARKHPL